MNSKAVMVDTATEKLILEQTPKQYIKVRPGPFGRPLSYVEVGYVVSRLNTIFNYDWDFDVTEQTVGKKQIYVKGRLTGRFARSDGTVQQISKTQFGGIDIKFNRQSGEMVSVADDLKAAASDALKKCASLLGIAQDLYWFDGGQHEEEEPGKVMTATDMKAKKAEVEDGMTHEPTGQETPEEDAPLYCEVCGELATERSGTNPKTGKWHAIFCSSEDKSHTKWLK